METQNKPLIILKHIGQDKRIYQQMQDNSWWSNRVGEKKKKKLYEVKKREKK